MNPSADIERHRDVIHALVRRFDLSNPRVVSAGVASAERDSDRLEILVDIHPGTTLLDLGGLQIELEDLFGRDVQVLTPGGLPERLRAQVLNEALPI